MTLKVMKSSITLILIAVASVQVSCGKKEDGPPPLQWGHEVSGSVTHENKPVSYGMVVLYAMMPGAGIDKKSGKQAPVATAMIKDGKYKIGNAPAGPMKVCILCDPDVDLATLLMTQATGPMTPPGMPAKKGGFADDRPMHKKGPPIMQPEAPPKKDMILKAPKSDGEMPRKKEIAAPFNPLVDKMSEETKTSLRAIHSKHGSFLASKIMFSVEAGVSQQSFNIVAD